MGKQVPEGALSRLLASRTLRRVERDAIVSRLHAAYVAMGGPEVKSSFFLWQTAPRQG